MPSVPPAWLPVALEQRRALRVAGALVLSAGVTEWMALGEVNAFNLAVRLGLALGLAGTGEVAVRPGPGRAAAASVAAVLAATGSAYLAHLAGGLQSPMFLFLPALPIGIAVVVQDDVRAAVLGAVSMVVGVLALAWAGGATAAQYVLYGSLMAILGVLGVYASVFLRRVLQRRQEALQARRESEAALAEAKIRNADQDRLALIGRLASGVAHEVNNPLAIVKANVELLAEEMFAARRAFSDDELKDAFSETSEGVERIRQVVMQLKSFAQTPLVSKLAHPASDLLAQAVSMSQVRIKPPITLTRHLPASLPHLKVDASRLVQTVLGLLVNASQALEDRPSSLHPRIDISARRDGDWLVVDVDDNGPGLSPEALSRLFTPFHTTKTEGRGLGMTLALAHDFATQSGGSITAENLARGGARFRLKLPAFDPGRETPQP